MRQKQTMPISSAGGAIKDIRRARLRQFSAEEKTRIVLEGPRGEACKALNVDRTSVRYRSIRPDDDALREAMKAVAAQRRRFGYRRIHVMLERQGITMNQKKLDTRNNRFGDARVRGEAWVSWARVGRDGGFPAPLGA